jgi:hypothetical protein
MAQHSSTSALLLMLAFSCAGRVAAQDDYVRAPFPTGPWGSVYLMSGASRLEQRDLLISDFRSLAPDAEMLDQDFSGFRQSISWWSAPSSAAISAIVGLHPFRNEQNRGPELRMGLQFASGVVGTLDYERSLRFPLDTLTSPSTGAVFVVDSIHTTQYSFVHRADRIGAEGSLIFRTGGRSRWSVYGGVGLGFGARVNATTSLTRTERGSVSFPGGGSQFDNGSSREERYANSGGAWFTAQVPFGFGFQLARHGDFLRRMDLFIEGRLGTLVQGSDELGTITTFGAQTLFGLRVRID